MIGAGKTAAFSRVCARDVLPLQGNVSDSEAIRQPLSYRWDDLVLSVGLSVDNNMSAEVRPAARDGPHMEVVHICHAGHFANFA